MIIEISDKTYELKTNLGAVKRVESQTKRSLGEVLANIGEATVDEQIRVLKIVENDKDSDLADAIAEEWDYMDLQNAVQEALMRMLFSGTPEQQEAKIDKYPVGESEKNMMRMVLGLPIKTIPSQTLDGGSALFEQLHE